MATPTSVRFDSLLDMSRIEAAPPFRFLQAQTQSSRPRASAACCHARWSTPALAFFLISSRYLEQRTFANGGGIFSVFPRTVLD